MTKYFELLLDLLEISPKEDFLKVAKVIEDNRWREIVIYHQYSPVFYGYMDLLDWKISIEDYLQIWDINSNILYDSTKKDSISFIKGNPKLQNDTIYIFDSISQGIIPDKENIIYC